MSQILQGILLAKQLLNLFIHEAAILFAKDEITAEQLAEIRARAEISDAAWDRAVEDARERLTGG